MKKTLLASALALCASSPVLAQTAPEPDYTFTGNAGLFSDYRFRGFSQTNLKPAIQGGFDFAHKSGFYLGNWNSNVDSGLYSGSNIEMDFYGGYKFGYQDFSFDVGALYYYYPGSTSLKGGTIYNTELYGAVGYGPFTLKYSHGVSDFFGTPDSKNNYYVDLSASFPLQDGWGVNGHIGYQKLKNDPAGLNSYVDYKLGVTKDLSGWTASLSLVTTNKKDWVITNKGKDAGRFGAVLGLSKSF
ncbi:TorF family putative porin [Pigmentiphaga soli]|uniref:TorF family putative porin n=1 Tax=Pigmentiphaga soli TaxID=1007095 RepID=A0ABP8HGA7_9BURK